MRSITIYPLPVQAKKSANMRLLIEDKIREMGELENAVLESVGSFLVLLDIVVTV